MTRAPNPQPMLPATSASTAASATELDVRVPGSAGNGSERTCQRDHSTAILLLQATGVRLAGAER